MSQRSIVLNTNWTPDIARFPGPKFLALSLALRDAIRGGVLPEGTRLPTVRDLAFRIGVTPGTVARAYQVLTQEGLLAATVGRGTFVAAASPRLGPTQPLFSDRQLVASAGLVDLRAPLLPEVGQTAAFAGAMATLAAEIADRRPLATGSDWIDYTSQRAEAPLRHAVRDWLADRILGAFGPDEVALTQGGQNAILLILLCCLRGERPVVMTEALSYPGFRYAARLARADVVGVEIDDHGIVPEALEAACRRYVPQVLCLTVDAQNPTAARMPAERRAQVTAIARTFDLQVIEDDCYSVANPTLPALRALAPERVWHVGGWSKTISAALRFGYVVCPQGMGNALRLTAQHSYFALSRPVSDLCLGLLASGEAGLLRAATQADMADRLALMVGRLGAYQIGWQIGLPFLWIPLPPGWRSSTFAREAEAQGVLVRSADEYALAHDRSPNAVRLAVNGAIPREDLGAAMGRLADLLARPPADLAV